MSMWQKVYDMLKGFKTPSWLVALLGQVQTLLIQVALQVGQNYISQLEAKIIEVASQNMPSKDKFNVVKKWLITTVPTLKDSASNLLIESVFAALKAKGFIKIV